MDHKQVGFVINKSKMEDIGKVSRQLLLATTRYFKGWGGGEYKVRFHPHENLETGQWEDDKLLVIISNR